MHKLLIFDCDGVLLDSERILNQAFADCLADIGLSLTLSETIHHFKGRSTQDCLPIVERLLGRSVDESLEKNFEKLAYERYCTQLVPIKGIAQALETLKQSKCVASSSSHEQLQHGLGLTNLLSFFGNNIFSASDVSLGKPHPDLFLYAAKQMGFAPADCIVIEDSVTGVMAAVAAGMKVYGFADLTSAEELEGAGATVFTDMSILPEYIDKEAA